MKLAFLFPRFTGPYGGERLILTLARELVKLGNEVTIFTHSIPTELKANYRDLKIIEGKYPVTKNHHLSTLLDLLLMPFLVNKINDDFDLLISMGWQSTLGGYWYKKIKRGKDIKTIYYCLEPPRIAYDLKDEVIAKSSLIKKCFLIPIITLIKIVDKLSVNSFDKIISISEWTHDQILKIYQKPSIIIYPGVEVSRFNKLSKAQARKKLGIPITEEVFLSVSKLHQRKRLDVALELFKQKKGKHSKFYIVGEGPYRKQLERNIRKMDLTEVKLLGQLSDEDVTLHMKSADFFVFTAINEPFGIAPLEAKAAGCTVIPEESKHSVEDWEKISRKTHNLFSKIIYDVE